MSKAFVICGPEASGNRYLVSLLCACGCEGRADHAQPFDDNLFIKLPEQRPNLIAFHRSFPHGSGWPDLVGICKYLQSNGYHVTVLVVIRDQHKTELSQVSNAHVPSVFVAREHINKAFRYIVTALSRVNVDFLFVPYTNLGRASYIKWLTNYLGLVVNEVPPFIDGDKKYE